MVFFNLEAMMPLPSPASIGGTQGEVCDKNRLLETAIKKRINSNNNKTTTKGGRKRKRRRRRRRRRINYLQQKGPVSSIMFSLPEGIPPPKKQESLSPAPGNDIRWYRTTSGSSHPLLATAKVNPTLAGTKTSGLDLRGLGHDCRQNKRPRHAVSKMCYVLYSDSSDSSSIF